MIEVNSRVLDVDEISPNRMIRTSYGLILDHVDDFMVRQGRPPYDDAHAIGRFNDDYKLLKQFVDSLFKQGCVNE